MEMNILSKLSELSKFYHSFVSEKFVYICFVVGNDESWQTPDGDLRPPVPGSGVVPSVGEVLREIRIERWTARVPTSVEKVALISVIGKTLVGQGVLSRGTGTLFALGDVQKA